MQINFTGITNSISPFIESIAAPHFKRHNILLDKGSISENILSDYDFCLLDIDNNLDLPSFNKFSLPIPSFAIGLGRNISESITLLRAGILFCFSLPISTDILCLTIKNFLEYEKTNNTSVKILSSRPVIYSPETIKNGLEIFTLTNNKWILKYQKNTIILSTIEKRILEYFFRTRKIISKSEIAFAGWENFDIKSNTIATTIKNIRILLKHIHSPYTIRNIYGYGYAMSPSLWE